MPTTAMNTRATVIPCLRYRDAPKAIEWLCSVLGFEKHRVLLADDGTVAHAQLSFGNGMVMLAAVTSVDTPFGRLTRQPDEIGGMETQSPYLVVGDADGVYQRAIAAVPTSRSTSRTTTTAAAASVAAIRRGICGAWAATTPGETGSTPNHRRRQQSATTRHCSRCLRCRATAA